MTRYLMYISYLGTRFRGIQKQVSRTSPDADDPFTVQGMLEVALKRFQPVKVPEVVISSRTDAGVHALRSAIHVDLERHSGTNYTPSELVRGINRFFEKSNIAIRVQECQVVPETFHARHSAIKRSYLYRLAVRKSDAPTLRPRGKDLIAQLPFWDWRRCYFIQNPEFDVEKFQSAASLFPGEKDFRTFMGTVRKNRDGSDKETSSVRLLQSINISSEQPIIPSYISSSSSHYNYWNVVFCSKSFVYRQVRRMVGVLVAVAQGKLQQSDVEYMLTEPSPNSWKSCIQSAPAYGLYLINVEYNVADLILENEKVENATKQTALTVSEHKASVGTMSLQELITKQRSKLQPCDTQVTLLNGQVMREIRTASGVSTSVIVGSATGFVVDNKPDLQVANILPGLNLGSQDVVLTPGLLKEHSISHVLSVGVVSELMDSDIQHLFVPLLDLPESDLSEVLDKCLLFIHRARRAGGCVFVHCNAGISRSATVVIAYLMQEGWLFEDAYQMVKSKRPIIQPNKGFVEFLKELDKRKRFSRENGN